MKGIEINLLVTDAYYAVAHRENRKSLEIKLSEGFLSCAVACCSHPQPLVLRASAEIGDRARIILLRHRIELYINGNLADEEWPSGDMLFCLGDKTESDFEICVAEYSCKRREEPCVISTFCGAEGWRPEENVFVGDCMPYVRGDEYHILYLKDRHHHYSKWGMGAHQWAHISTKDFSRWSVHPMAVEITDPTECSICTGSWIKQGELEYLFYTVRRGGALAAPIKRSISADGFHFEKDERFGFLLPEKYNQAVARDPKVIKGSDGTFHMLLTTALVAEGKGCLAHFISRDLNIWEDTGNPIYISDDATEPECPDYIVYNGRYYLIFSLGGRARYMISDSEFENFKSPKQPEIPCASVPKGAVWNEKIVFVGFNGIDGYAGTMTFKSATADTDGELVFE
ncbi:MAG: hypothetical protein IKM32_01395 [Clostridia bacterium]|nr:hypothetical protein [Clostridia bacterium]